MLCVISVRSSTGSVRTTTGTSRDTERRALATDRVDGEVDLRGLWLLLVDVAALADSDDVGVELFSALLFFDWGWDDFERLWDWIAAYVLPLARYDASFSSPVGSYSSDSLLLSTTRLDLFSFRAFLVLSCAGTSGATLLDLAIGGGWLDTDGDWLVVGDCGCDGCNTLGVSNDRLDVDGDGFGECDTLGDFERLDRDLRPLTDGVCVNGALEGLSSLDGAAVADLDSVSLLLDGLAALVASIVDFRNLRRWLRGAPFTDSSDSDSDSEDEMMIGDEGISASWLLCPSVLRVTGGMLRVGYGSREVVHKQV